MINYLTSHISTPFSINIFFFIFFLILNFAIPILIGRLYKFDFRIPVLIVLGNFIFFLIFLYFENSKGTDSLGWYRKPYLNDMVEFGIRNEAVIKIAAIYKSLEINYLNLALSLNIFSSVIFLFYYLKVKNFYFFKDFLIFFIFFMLVNSGILFWSNSLIKENFVFFAIILFLLSINDKNFNPYIFLTSIIILFVFRPIIGFMILISSFIFLNLKLIFNKEYKKLLNLIILTIIPLSVVTFFIFREYNFPFSFEFFGLFVDRINSMIHSNSSYYKGTLTINPDNLNVFTTYFIYYFYPLKLSIDPYYLLLLIQNLTNLILISLFLILIIFKFKSFKKFIKKINYCNIFFIYIILYNSFIPFTSYNIGISLRQKWMLLVVMTYLALYYFDFLNVDRRKNKAVTNTLTTDKAKNKLNL